jgi:hypothetical protein
MAVASQWHSTLPCGSVAPQRRLSLERVGLGGKILTLLPRHSHRLFVFGQLCLFLPRNSAAVYFAEAGRCQHINAYMQQFAPTLAMSVQREDGKRKRTMIVGRLTSKVWEAGYLFHRYPTLTNSHLPTDHSSLDSEALSLPSHRFDLIELRCQGHLLLVNLHPECSHDRST